MGWFTKWGTKKQIVDMENYITTMKSTLLEADNRAYLLNCVSIMLENLKQAGEIDIDVFDRPPYLEEAAKLWETVSKMHSCIKLWQRNGDASSLTKAAAAIFILASIRGALNPDLRPYCKDMWAFACQDQVIPTLINESHHVLKLEKISGSPYWTVKIPKLFT